MMDYFAYLIANKTSAARTVKIRKIYINEDPTQEDTEPCPNCLARSQSSNVRYMYVNLQEAIYKCEAPNCMYPFQNFKFKNYTDNTVYVYTSAEETPPALEDFVGQSFPNNALSPVKHPPGQLPSMNESSLIDFGFNFFSPERSSSNSNRASEESPAKNASLNIFDSPSLSYKNLVQDFDTGFIDDILQDLNQSSTEKTSKPVLASPVRVVESKSKPGRQLKRCLQMFKETAVPSDVTFKVPPLPGAEIPSPPKIKPKKHSPLRRSKHARRTHLTSGGSSSEKVPKKRNLKPLEFIESINSMHPKAVASPEPEVKPSCNRRVENMLNFIERSMKNRQPKPLPATTPRPASPPKHSAKRPIESHRSYRKTHRYMSLSEAVLNDHRFEYSTSESEQEDAPETVPSPVKSDGDASSESVTSQEDPPTIPDQSSLPSFENLLMHIHPGEPKMQHQNFPPVGFRSAGSSPTRVPQWAQTPPRRIHSMESLCDLLE